MDGVNKRHSICFFTDVFISGGVEKVLIDTIKLLHNDYDITLYVATNNVDFNLKTEVEKYAKVEIGNLNITKKVFILLALPWTGKHILEKIINHKYDCMFVCKPSINTVVFTNVSKKYIYWNHTDKDVMYANNNLSFLKKINKVRLTYIYKKYNLILSVVPEIAQSIGKAFNLSNSEELINPINKQLIIQKSQSESPDFHKSNKLNICSVGRLSEEKRFDMLINAASKLDNSKYQLFILGEGEERENLQNLINQNKLENNVYLIGNKSNPYVDIKQCDLLVSSSGWESFGLTILEAMILKTPVLSTNTVGARFLLNKGKLGFLAGNDNEFLGMLKELVDNPDKLNCHVDDAFDYAMQFDSVEYKDKIIKYIDGVINS